MKILSCRNLSWGLVSLMALAVLMWGLAPSSSSAAGPVKIGLLAPFSPPGDPAAGKRMRWGAELAIEYINKEMGGVLGRISRIFTIYLIRISFLVWTKLPAVNR